MDSDLQDWCREVGAAVCQLAPRYQKLYSRQGSNDHQWAVAEDLERRFGDPVLARAGFLHGVNPEDLWRLPESVEGATVRPVLKEWERLRALDHQDVDLPDRSQVLSSIREARAILLFVLEHLHRLDPTGRLARWSAEFPVRPGPLPGALSDEPTRDPDDGSSRDSELCRNAVASTARFFGLWHEHNVVEDAALFYSDRKRFGQLLEFVLAESDRERGECAKLKRLVEQVLQAAGVATQVCWEWHHIGAIDKKFETKPGSWRRQIHRAGFVKVICPDPQACYGALHALHTAMRHRPTELRDQMAPSASSYCAIRSIVVPPPGSGVEAEAVKVRLVPATLKDHRLEPAGLSHLTGIEHRLHTSGEMNLRVFTPDGQDIVLAPGSTVLNFAYRVNHRWVAYLAGATVNRRPVDALHALRPGDIVWLDISPRPIPLPRDWEQHIALGTADKIRRRFRRFYRSALLRDGRDWLREQLLLRGVEAPEDDDDLDDFLEEAAATIGLYPPSRQPMSGWLVKQLGILAADMRGEKLPFELEIRGDEAVAKRIVTAVEHILRGSQLVTLRDLRLPEKVKVGLSSIVVCKDCRPGHHQHMMGTLEGSVLKLHAAAASCGQGGFVLSRIRRSARPQYFVVEAGNRIGIAAEVLAVFKRQQVNLIDIAAIQLGPEWSIVRVQTGYINSRRVEELQRELKELEGVTRVLGPNDGKIDSLEAHLPPRRVHNTLNWTKPAPYYCGSDINSDAYFYGMDNQLAVLRRCYEDVLNPEVTRGKSVWIHGPRRVGKTSLIQAFRRELAHTAFPHCVTVYFEAAPGQSWTEAADEIGHSLLEQMRVIAGTAEVADLGQGDRGRLDELIAYMQQRLDCTVILVIDEAVGLLEGARRRKDVEELKRFWTAIRRRPGVLLVWVGPEAPAQQLDTDTGNILQKAEPLRVEPLTREAVTGLLEARKLAPRYHIEISPRLVETIFTMTAGNPYWVSHLGNEMWKQATRSPGGTVRYTPELLSNARDAVFDLGVPFLDRIRGSNRETGALCLRVLQTLARADTGNGGGSVSLTLPGIRNRIASDGSSTTNAVLEVLEDLHASGSVVNERVDSVRRWKISSPMLADYLIYLDS